MNRVLEDMLHHCSLECIHALAPPLRLGCHCYALCPQGTTVWTLLQSPTQIPEQVQSGHNGSNTHTPEQMISKLKTS